MAATERMPRLLERRRQILDAVREQGWRVRVVAPPVEPIEGRRIRVGYLSSDFREHPTSRLINGLLRLFHSAQSVEQSSFATR